VFLTCQKQEDARAIDGFWGGTLLNRLWNKLLIRCKRRTYDIATKKFNGKPIQACIAPEPSDIFWENLGVPYKQRMVKLLTTWLVTILVLAISFVI
jgi:hypothetical protein